MNDLDMAQLTIDLAWDIVNRVDNDPIPARGAIHRINWRGPDPRFEFTATGLMLAIDRDMPYLLHLLTPWGTWEVTDYGNFTTEAITQLLSDYAAEEVPENDRAYWNHYYGRSLLYRLYAIRRFGEVELPMAVGTAGLATGNAAGHPGMMRTYPHNYKPYWDMRRRWSDLYKQFTRDSRFYQKLGLEQYRVQASV